ncbi:MAG: RHS repeat-associated core domain-containing protein [Acidobacteriia bacterium]|nr:RHS repeat-associated core domain-containing protein [Terriglobia bacterium]
MATTAQLSENSHPGFAGIKAALCLAEIDANSNFASGMQPCLRRNGTGSRCSGKERDAESGLDYFLARYYSGAQGRFTSPDPENAGAIPADPQSWNAYAYSRNNPLAFTDPNGKRYRVSWDGGSSEEMSDPEYEDYKSKYIDPIGYVAGGGIIYQKDVKGFVRLGTVQYLMSDKMWALIHGMEMAKPTVDALAIGTGIITGGIAALEFIAGGTALTTLSIPAATLPPLVSNPTLQSIVNKLFQVTDKLPGGTAGAVRYELATGDLMSPSGHSRKAQDVIVALTNLLKGGRLSYNDQIVSRQIIQELSDALKTQPRR